MKKVNLLVKLVEEGDEQKYQQEFLCRLGLVWFCVRGGRSF